MSKKGIILAGGNGSRLYPLTYGVSKQLLPVYNKPMITYAISTLLKLGVDHITIIVKKGNVKPFADLLKEVKLPVAYDFVEQDKPNGLAEAYILAEQYIKDCRTALILGDNIFHGAVEQFSLTDLWNLNTIFGYKVKNPSAYGVAHIHKGELVAVVEKPTTLDFGDIAVPGLYLFNEDAVDKAKECRPSKRGEIEIVDIINQYIEEGAMKIRILPESAAWFDCGTFDDLLDAGNYVKAIETRTNSYVGRI